MKYKISYNQMAAQKKNHSKCDSIFMCFWLRFSVNVFAISEIRLVSSRRNLENERMNEWTKKN